MCFWRLNDSCSKNYYVPVDHSVHYLCLSSAKNSVNKIQQRIPCHQFKVNWLCLVKFWNFQFEDIIESYFGKIKQFSSLKIIVKWFPNHRLLNCLLFYRQLHNCNFWLQEKISNRINDTPNMHMPSSFEQCNLDSEINQILRDFLEAASLIHRDPPCNVRSNCWGSKRHIGNLNLTIHKVLNPQFILHFPKDKSHWSYQDNYHHRLASWRE